MEEQHKDKYWKKGILILGILKNSREQGSLFRLCWSFEKASRGD